MIQTALDAAVENIIINILVADATDGDTPRLNWIGLKIDPPPRPNAPETKPPTKPNNTNLVTFLFVYLRSLSHNPFLNFYFNLYSFFTIVRETNVVMVQNTRKNINSNQSVILHLLIPIIDYADLPPLKRLTNTSSIKTRKHILSFVHYLCDFSFSSTLLSFFISSQLTFVVGYSCCYS